MDDKFIVVGLEDERAGHIAEVLKNKTCKQILDFLAETREASEQDISKALESPINTIEYNLKKLIKAGLIEKTKNFFWSVKGRKIDMYKLARKHIIISPKIKKPNLTALRTILPVLIIVGLFFVGVLIYSLETQPEPDIQQEELLRFKSGEELIKAFSEARQSVGYLGVGGGITMELAGVDMAVGTTASTKSVDYSETNIQVEGVDEADIIKTDGEYIYAIAKGKLIIFRAYPADESKILSTIELGDFSPNELFIHEDRLLIFGSVNYNFEDEIGNLKGRLSYLKYMNAVSVRLYDVSSRTSPKLLRVVDFEGNYLTSRKIDSDVYFMINSYPYFYRDKPICQEIIPRYRDSKSADVKIHEIESIARCTDIGYIEPIQASNFITIASISMIDEDKDIEKEIIAGNGQNVYASSENLYIAQTSQSDREVGGLFENREITVITKFKLEDGKIEFAGSGEVKGHILNQFSMDEYDGHFRIATTTWRVLGGGGSTANNVYVLDENLEVVGKLEDLAPGEKIYSVRFMGKRGYVVTFKKVDPLFVIDLSEPKNPNVLGKLKIPGYSDYLHPYDETHLIGIGKDTVEAAEGDFAWYQGIKMAIFDVSDVENPIEMYKVIIGDRGTDSEVLHDHKAFLFDKEKNLLVLPIILAEIRGEKTRDNQYGEYTFQGAYVYDINLEDGFELRGRVTHYDDDSEFKKSGFYFRGDSSIKRSLYIEDVLYTLSDSRLQLNDLDDLDRINVLEFGEDF